MIQKEKAFFEEKLNENMNLNFKLSLKNHQNSNILPNFELLKLKKNPYRFQSGFQKPHLPDASLSNLTDINLKGFNFSFLTGIDLINLQKAFENIYHKTLYINNINPAVDSDLFSYVNDYCSVHQLNETKKMSKI